MPIIRIDWCRKSTVEERKAIIEEMTDCLVNDCNARRKIVTVLFNEYEPEYFGLAGKLASETENFESSVIVTLDWCARDIPTKEKVLEHAIHSICQFGYDPDSVSVLFVDYPKDAAAQAGVLKCKETGVHL